MSQPYLFKERRKCPSLHRLVGRSSVMLQVYQKIECLANTDTTVLIVGETGTGKELAAEANHRLSSRRSAPIMQVNCSPAGRGLQPRPERFDISAILKPCEKPPDGVHTPLGFGRTAPLTMLR